MNPQESLSQSFSPFRSVITYRIVFVNLIEHVLRPLVSGPLVPKKPKKRNERRKLREELALPMTALFKKRLGVKRYFINTQ